jgi:hypothetical protein
LFPATLPTLYRLCSFRNGRQHNPPIWSKNCSGEGQILVLTFTTIVLYKWGRWKVEWVDFRRTIFFNVSTPWVYSFFCKSTENSRIIIFLVKWPLRKVHTFTSQDIRIQIFFFQNLGLWVSKDADINNVDFKDINLPLWQNAPKKVIWDLLSFCIYTWGPMCTGKNL